MFFCIFKTFLIVLKKYCFEILRLTISTMSKIIEYQSFSCHLAYGVLVNLVRWRNSCHVASVSYGERMFVLKNAD